MNKRYVDPRDAAQFSSLWQVVVHATGPTANRWKLYAAAHKAMVKDKKWRDYRMLFSDRGHHLGFVMARPKDWFLLPEGGHITQAEGPFRSKKLILSRLGVKTSKQRGPGSYIAAGHTLFTRDAADSIIPGLEGTLP